MTRKKIKAPKALKKMKTCKAPKKMKTRKAHKKMKALTKQSHERDPGT